MLRESTVYIYRRVICHLKAPPLISDKLPPPPVTPIKNKTYYLLKASSKCIEIRSICYDVMKRNQKPINAKRILISTALACFEALFLIR